MDYIPAEAKFIHSSRVKVLDEDICCLKELCENRLAIRGSGIKGERFLVGVELQEIVARTVGIKLQLVTGGITGAGAFDFDNVGSQPCQELST